MRMPRKHTALALTGSAALVVGVALWPTVAAADGPVLEGTFVVDRLEEAFLDHDANGLLSLGDEFVYTNASTGGLGDATEYGRCQLHQVDPGADSAILHCVNTTSGARGSLTAQGVTRVRISTPVLLEPASWAVTGGTGEFASASGEFHLEAFEGTGLDLRILGTYRVVLGH
jgi:hypothetical protein